MQGTDALAYKMANYVQTSGSLWVPAAAADDGSQFMQLTGSIETVNGSPVTGIKTVIATAAEILRAHRENPIGEK